MKLKKLILPVMLFLILIPFMVNAETCDTDKITIDSVTIQEKSNNVTEVEQPVIEGKKIKVNLKMMEVNDSIEYKLVVKNNSNEDYELDKNSLNANSDYIEYTLKTDDDSLVVKSGKTKDVYLKVQYKNEVPDSEFSDGKFNDNKSFVLNLLNGQTIEVPDTIKNPKTGDRLIFLMLICIVCVGITMYMVLNRKKAPKYMVLLLAMMITIPASVYALCKIEVSIESNVTIEKNVEQKYDVAYVIEDIGNTWFKESELSKYDISRADCYTAYIGEQIEANKYKVCSGTIIYKDEKQYSAGETVNLKKINTRWFDTWDYDNNTSLCTEQSSNVIVCSSSSIEENSEWNYWTYGSYYINKYGYTYLDNDKDTMNFSSYDYDDWIDFKQFGIIAPTTFTMPEHSALFVTNQTK